MSTTHFQLPSTARITLGTFKRLYRDPISSVFSTRESVYTLVMFDADSVAAVAADVEDCVAHVVIRAV
jgi:hypothetical protein